MKLAFYSGTFDPFHLGHKAFVAEVLAQELADHVLVVPEPMTWRKKPVASYSHRLEMLNSVYSDNPNVTIVDSLKEGLGEKHTVRSTIDWLTAHYSEDGVSIMMGGDVFEHVEAWDNFRELSAAIKGFIVGLRSEDDGEIAVEIAAQYSLPLEMVSTNKSGLSSTVIRQNESVAAEVLDARIKRYVKEHQLYS